MRDPKVAGALYDFMGYLTTRYDHLAVGATHNCVPLLDKFKDWAALRGLDIEAADVEGWSIGEALIEAVLQELDRLKSGIKGFVDKAVKRRIGKYALIRNRWTKINVYSVTLTKADDVPKFTDEIVDEIIQKYGDAPQVELVKVWVPDVYKKSKMKTRAVRGEISGGKVAITYKKVGIEREPTKQDKPFFELEFRFTGPNFTEKL